MQPYGCHIDVPVHTRIVCKTCAYSSWSVHATSQQYSTFIVRDKTIGSQNAKGHGVQCEQSLRSVRFLLCAVVPNLYESVSSFFLRLHHCRRTTNNAVLVRTTSAQQPALHIGANTRISCMCASIRVQSGRQEFHLETERCGD